MTTAPAGRRRFFKTGVFTLLLGAILGVTGYLSAPASAGNHESGGITLCHASNATDNPYQVITVSFDGSNGALQGPDHTGHGGLAFDFTADPAVAYPPPHNGDQWGDIIPPYSWDDGNGGSGSYEGKNWPADLDTAEEIAAFLATSCGAEAEDPECEADQTGTYPDCVDPECEADQTGTYPDCVDPVVVVTDACPTLAGVQASASECPVDVRGVVITKSAPAQVGSAALPRTGSDTLPLVGLSLGLILMGAGVLLLGREGTATV